MSSNRKGSETMTCNYGKLSEMVSFFNQRFHMEQLVTYGYKFLHEKLDLLNSAIYIKNNDIFELGSKFGYDEIPEYIKSNSALSKIAILHGRLLVYSFNKYFEEDFINSTEMQIIIPLIVKSELVAFIVSNGVSYGELSPEDIEFMEKGNILINNALSLAKADMDYLKMSRTLDKDIFSLLFLNQSTRLLMSENEVDKIYIMCIDIIRELTASRVTSLGLYDENSKRVIIKGYQDVNSNEKINVEFEFAGNREPTEKIIYHINNDEAELKSIFKDLSGFSDLEAEHVVLIVKDKIIGFITISDTINNQEYDKSTYEMIESMAASIYISIANASYIKEIKEK